MEKRQRVPKPYLMMPEIPSAEICIHIPKKIMVLEYFAIADGSKHIFTEEDGVKELGKQKILDPSKVSYMNLFINAVLQPKENYEVTQGMICLKTEDVPICGATVVLQMFIV
ncbi:DUF4183 domain-containing protein [Niallia alba]|nr:DUF4183 domain-containing protein [Niallia circulans]MCB5239097.1 DUF4183 domain-containing protein [Niallia circulans]